MRQTKYQFATWLRTVGMLMILLCHFTHQSGNSYLVMSSQFFNIGNDIFFIMSGFLFGIQGKALNSMVQWYKKRIKRIYVPYEMMIIVLFLVHIVLGIQISVQQWGKQFLGLQGWSGVDGAIHTWFITSLLICYLLTPLISEIVLDSKENRKKIWKIVVIVCIVPVGLAYLVSSDTATILTPVCWYTLAYILGNRFSEMNLTARKVSISVVVMCIAFALRILCRQQFDGTVFYNLIVVGYTHAIGAFCIFFIFAYIFKNIKAPKCVEFLSNISFEIYLWHYMFTDGPIRLFGLTPSWILDCILVFAVTILVSWCFNKIASKIYKII